MRLPKLRIAMRRLMIVIVVFAFGMAICPREKPYLGLLPLVAWWLASLRNWGVISLAILLLIYCAAIEILMGIPLPLWVYVPIAMVLSGPLWPTGPLNQLKQKPERLIPFVGVNALILGLFLTTWTTREPLLRDLYSIKPGMTVVEVRRIMASYNFEGSYDAYSLMFRHSDEPLMNADFGVVTFHDGKVVNVEFLPD